MKNLFGTLLLTVALLISSTCIAKTHSYFSPVSDLEEIVIDQIKKAFDSIDIAIYTFSSAAVKKAILSKLNSGVKVRVLINDGKKESVKSFMKPLIDNGAQVRFVSKINHHKFLIIDKEVLINSSGNFSGSSRAKSYDENLVVTDDKERMLQGFQSEFDRLFIFSNTLIGEKTVIKKDPLLYKKMESDNNDIVLFTSNNFYPKYRGDYVRFKNSKIQNDKGQGSLDSVLIEAIDNATTTIKIATGHFRSWPLYKAVKRAIDRGIKVDMVLDGQEYISNSKQKSENKKLTKCLAKYNNKIKCYAKGMHYGRLIHSAGANVRFKYYSIRWHFPYAKQMHHKYMIVDGETLYSGSYNWSFNAEFSTFENVAIYSSNKIIKNFKNNFLKIFNYGGGDKGYKTLVKTYKSATHSIKTVFAPISLTIKQIDNVKRVARSKCPTLYTGAIEAKSCRF